MDAYQQLRAWLTSKGWTLRTLASVLGIGESAIWAWGQGRTRPSLDLAVALEDVSEGSVPARAWACQEAAKAALRRSRKIDTRRADSGGKSAREV